MSDRFIDKSDFQFRTLRRVRLCEKPDKSLFDNVVPSWLTVSSRYGIAVVAVNHNKLIALRCSDVHRLRATKADINEEVKDIPFKVIKLSNSNQPMRLMALSCNCSGRVLSVLLSTQNGPFVYLYDVCSLSLDSQNQRKPVQCVRLSSDQIAQACALQWNPAKESVFVVTTSDGAISCYSFTIEESSTITLLGTARQNRAATCISWSPKGKQFVVGDESGVISQYKPEVKLVRTIPSPKDNFHLKDIPVHCVGICWLATTEFLVAYSSTDGSNRVDIAVLCVKKDASPVWKHFDDITYSSSQSTFNVKIRFIPIFDWKMVLCSSSRSCEVMVFGKTETDLKVWALDDGWRIEMPLDSQRNECFPIGIDVDYSSVLPVKMGDNDVEKPPCPIIFIMASNGSLLSFNAVPLSNAYQNLNRAPDSLPSNIYGDVEEMVPTDLKENKTPLPSMQSEKNIIPSHVKDLPLFEKTNMATNLKSESIDKIPALTAPPADAETLNTIWNVDVQEEKAKLNKIMGHREDFRKKLTAFDTHFHEMCEVNDWMEDIKNSVIKQIDQDEDLKLEEELVEVGKLRSIVQSWMESLQTLLKESIYTASEHAESVNNYERLPTRSEKMLDFSTMHRFNKLLQLLNSVEMKISQAETAMKEMPNRNVKPKKSELVLSTSDEQMIAALSKNVCKVIFLKRKVLYDLQYKVSALSGKYHSMKNTPSPKSPFRLKSLSNSLFSSFSEKNLIGPPERLTSAIDKNKLMSVLSNRGESFYEPKIIKLNDGSRRENVVYQKPTAADVESRILQAVLKTPTKMVIDIGVQSGTFLSQEDEKPAELFKPDSKFSNPLATGHKKLVDTSTQPSSPGNESKEFAVITSSPTFVTQTWSKPRSDDGLVTSTVSSPNCTAVPATTSPNFTAVPATTSTVLQETTLISTTVDSAGTATTTSSSMTPFSLFGSNLSLNKSVTATANPEVQTQSLPFSTPVTTESAVTTTAEIKPPLSSEPSSILFTFKLPSSSASTTQPQKDVSATTSSQPVITTTNTEIISNDDGMMDADIPSPIPTNLFSSASSLGGGSTSSPNTMRNVFGGGMKFGATSQPKTSSSLFGTNTSTVFGGGPPGSSSLFSGASAQSSPFSNALANPQATQSIFGSRTSESTFGGAPSFGSKPVFGAPSPLSAAAGQQSVGSNTGLFSSFTKSGVGFGTLASQQKPASSLFGGSNANTFGALAQQTSSSVFGGGANTSSSSFSSWR